MTSENENELIAEEKPLIIAESTEDEPTISPAQVVKRVGGGRKKREDSAVTNESDTQPLFEQPVIVEGKRSRKPTSRLEITELSPPKKELSIPQGHGKPLGEIPYVNHQLTHVPIDDLSHLRSLCFGRRASKTNSRKNLQDFNGFAFTRDSEDFQRHLTTLTKLKKEQIDQIGEILGLDSSSDATQILEFLLEPKDLGKAIVERPVRKAPKPVAVVEEIDEMDEIEEDEEEDEAAAESDEDYLGSDDDEEDERTNHDDPEDFAYQPGKKAPKKKSKSSTTLKRKRATTTRTKRSSKKRKISPRTKKVEAKVEEKIDEPAAPTTTTTDTNEPSQADEEN